MWEASASVLRWVSEHAPDWIQAFTALAALWFAVAAGREARALAQEATKKLPEWFKERRTVHRSQIATEALVAALEYLDAAKRAWGKDETPRTKSKFRSDLAKAGEAEGTATKYAAFLPKYRAALAVLNATESEPLSKVVGLQADIAAAHSAIDNEIERINAPSGGWGSTLLDAANSIEKAIEVSLFPIAQMARPDDPPVALPNFGASPPPPTSPTQI